MSTRKSNESSSHSFSNIPSANIPRSQFNRSSGLKTTFDAGLLIPVFVDEALPGDTFNLKMTTYCRLATPLHPILDNMYIDSFFFAVPVRLVYDEWERLNGAQDSPGDSIDFLVPQMVSPSSIGYAALSLSDYFGLPVGVGTLTHSSLWHRAYALIWNEWFRDENLQDSITVDKDEGPDDPTDYVLQRRGKRKDYFTGGLPWALKGGVSVPLPIGDQAPIHTNAGSGEPINVYSRPHSSYRDLDATTPKVEVSGSLTNVNDYLFADLSQATGNTINALRESFQIQKLLERDARGGTRYTEMIQSQFNVTSEDQRLQRPEFLGGGTPSG